jgi:hypothetical protein
VQVLADSVFAREHSLLNAIVGSALETIIVRRPTLPIAL